jgi:hypothetical protein
LLLPHVFPTIAKSVSSHVYLCGQCLVWHINFNSPRRGRAILGAAWPDPHGHIVVRSDLSARPGVCSTIRRGTSRIMASLTWSSKQYNGVLRSFRHLESKTRPNLPKRVVKKLLSLSAFTVHTPTWHCVLKLSAMNSAHSLYFSRYYLFTMWVHSACLQPYSLACTLLCQY